MKISVVVLTYNHEMFIESCLESIKYQIQKFREDNNSIQIVVSDDCSTDKTVTVVKKWKLENQSLFEDIVILENTRNRGTCRNLICALEYVHNDYVKMIGGDDLLSDSSVFDFLVKLENYDVVFGLPFFYEVDGDNNYFKRLRQYQKLHCSNINAQQKPFYNLIRSWNAVYAPSVIIRKELIMDPRVIDNMLEYKYVDDLSMYLAISQLKEIRHIYIPEFVVVYRRTPKSTFKVKRDELKEDIIRVYKQAAKTSKNVIDKIVMYDKLFFVRFGFGINLASMLYNFNWIIKRKKNNTWFFSEDCYNSVIRYIHDIDETSHSHN